MDYRPALAALMLTACQSGPAPVRVETVTVKVPTPVYCVTRDQIPDDPPSIAGELTGNAAQDIGPVTVVGLLWKQVAQTMRALLAGCVEP